MLLKIPAEKRCLKAVCAVCLIVWWMGGFSKLLLSCSGCIGRSVCLFSETLFLYWASIVMCVADGDPNFRPHNNRTDNLFPVYIVLGSLQPDKSTHTHTLHFSSNWLLRIMPNPHKDIFGLKLLLVHILCQLLTIWNMHSFLHFFASLIAFIGWDVSSHTNTVKQYEQMQSWMHSNYCALPHGWLSLACRDVDVSHFTWWDKPHNSYVMLCANTSKLWSPKVFNIQ